MTVENLHDAIGLLPSDLVAETDRRRSNPRRVIPWQRYAAMAACAAMILCASWFVTRLTAPKGAYEAASADMMQEIRKTDALPGDAAPAEQENQDVPAEAPATLAPESAAEDFATYPASENASTAAGHTHQPASSDLCIDHGAAWCGNSTAVLHLPSGDFSLSGDEAVALMDLLYYLPYSQEALCRCTAEFTVDTEMGEGYEISLGQYFVRFDGKQAALSEEKAAQIQLILHNAGIDN